MRKENQVKVIMIMFNKTFLYFSITDLKAEAFAPKSIANF